MTQLQRKPLANSVISISNIMEESTLLVLTRRPSESVRIGPNVTITIVEIAGGKVRIGISAPDDVSIVRGEIEHKPQKEASHE